MYLRLREQVTPLTVAPMDAGCFALIDAAGLGLDDVSYARASRPVLHAGGAAVLVSRRAPGPRHQGPGLAEPRPRRHRAAHRSAERLSREPGAVTGQDLAAAAAALPAAGYASYLRDTLRGKTQPNRASWALWAAAASIAFAAELAQHTPLTAALVTLVLGADPALILAASLASRQAYWQAGRLEWACAALACAALAAWALTRRGDTAIALAIAADLLAAVPTIAKSWSNPQSETAGTYIASAAGAAIMLLAVPDWSFAAAAFPAYVVAICATITGLITRPRTPAARAKTAFAAALIPLGASAWAALHIAGILAPPQSAAASSVPAKPAFTAIIPHARQERRPPRRHQARAALPPPPSPARPTPARHPPPHPSSPAPSPSATEPYPSPAPGTPSPSQTHPGSPTPTAASPSPSATATHTPGPSASPPPPHSPKPAARKKQNGC